MPLRVAFDLDGTVADMDSTLHQEALTLFGEEVPARPPGPAEAGHHIAGPTSGPAEAGHHIPGHFPAMEEFHLTERQQVQLWDHVKTIDNFWTTLPELEPGIIARIARAASERRWEVIFFTTRPSTAGELTQIQSQRWLSAHGFEYPSVFVVQGSRGKIADALQLDAFVDDRPENCLDIAVESTAKAIMVWHGDLKDVPAAAKRLGVRPVSTISEAVALLEQLDDLRNQPGIMRSIKRALGTDK